MLNIGISVLISILAAAFLYHRARPRINKSRAIMLTFLRSLSLCIALLLLLNPIFSFLRTKMLKAQVIMLSDISKSMDNGGKKAWMKQQEKLLQQKYSQAGYDVIKHDFASGLNGDTSDTRLAPALKELANLHDLSKVEKILLFSDGWLKDEEMGNIKQLGLPITAIADSTGFKEIDLRVNKVKNNRHAYRGEPALFKAEIAAQNYSGPAQVRLLQNKQILLSKDVTLKDDETQSVEFTHSFPSLGFQALQVQIQAQDIKEKLQSNNSYPTAVEVLAEKEQIFMLSDKIGWDNKFISDVIAANSRWENTVFTLQKGMLKQGDRQVEGFGTKLPSVLIVINNGELSADAKLLDLVRRVQASGGGILWQGMPLSELSSVLALAPSNVSGSYQGFLKLTPENQAFPFINIESSELKNIPPLDFYFLKATAGTSILASIDNQSEPPAIAIKSTSGKVINLAFLNLWRWQLQSSNSSYRDIFGNFLTWLSRGNASSFKAIYENSYFQGEQFSIGLRAEDSLKEQKTNLSPRLIIKDENANEVYNDFMTLLEEDYRATLSLEKAGNYSFEISDPASKDQVKGFFNVAKGSLEERDFHYNLPLLQWITSISGGNMLNQGDLSSFEPPKAQQHSQTNMYELPLYRKWYVLTLFLLAFCLELFFRRRWGML